MNLRRYQNEPIVTYGLIGLCVIMFLVESVFPGGSTNVTTLVKLGANFAPLVADGEYWRLFTAMWLHIGWMHITMNMLSLYIIGINIERIYGHWRFLLIYLFSGYTGNLMSYYHNASSMTTSAAVSAGASTAIFGVTVAAAMLFVTMQGNPYVRQFAQSMWVIIAINLVFNLFPGAGVDIYGHLGGIIGGGLMALTLPPKGNRFHWPRYMPYLLTTGLVLLTAYISYVILY